MDVNYPPQVIDLLERLNFLEELYRENYKTDDGVDQKILQGIERCIELRMKLFGYDGKTQTAAPVPPDNVVSIDLKQLSEKTLLELKNLANK